MTKDKAAPVQEPALVIYQGEIAKSNLPKGFTGMLYTTPPAAPVQQASCLVRRLDGVADLRRLEGDHDEADVIDEAVAILKANQPAAQPAPVPEGRDWSLLEATQESLREHMAEIKRLKEAPPAVPLTDEEIDKLFGDGPYVPAMLLRDVARAIEAKLKEKNGS
jgi:hypothetical protein